MRRHSIAVTNMTLLVLLGGAGCSSLHGPTTSSAWTSRFWPTAGSAQKPSATETPGEAPIRIGEMGPQDTVQACLTTADQLFGNGHHREAALLLEKARTINPQLECSRQLAAAYDLQNDLAKAKREFAKAVQATPDDPDLLNDYACFLDRQGDYSEAQRLLRHSLDQRPDFERARVNLGASLARQGKLEESFAEFSQALGPAAAHSNIGAILAGQGREDEAQRAFQEALRLNPDLPQARAFLAALSAGQRD